MIAYATGGSIQIELKQNQKLSWYEGPTNYLVMIVFELSNRGLITDFTCNNVALSGIQITVKGIEYLEAS